MSDIVKEGPLTKSPPKDRNKFGGFKHWRDRYFVLTRSRLSYYEDRKAYQRGDKCKGYIEIKDCTDVAVRSNPSSKREFVIVLRTSHECSHEGRVFELCAKNQIYQGEWLKAINSCLPKQPEETSDDEAIVIEEQAVYRPTAPTPLQESIAKAKERSSLVEARGDLSTITDEGMRAETEPDAEEDNIFDDVFETPGMEIMREKDFYQKRESQRSSGYASCERDSVCSRCSGISSDLWIRIDGGGADRFEISTKFEGPRYTANMKIYKAKSMGCLVEGNDCSSRLSPQEHLNIIRSRCNAEQELKRSRASSDNIYENIPFFTEGRVGRRPCHSDRQGTEPSSVPRRPRPMSEQLRKGSYSEKPKESSRRSASCGATCSNRMNNDNSGRSSVSNTATNARVGSSLRDKERPPSLVNGPPPLTRRQCSRIEEKTEEGIQQRSNSDPTSSRQKRPKAVDFGYV